MAEKKEPMAKAAPQQTAEKHRPALKERSSWDMPPEGSRNAEQGGL